MGPARFHCATLLSVVKKGFVRREIRTPAHRSGLRPERSALDHSAILTRHLSSPVAADSAAAHRLELRLYFAAIFARQGCGHVGAMRSDVSELAEMGERNGGKHRGPFSSVG